MNKVSLVVTVLNEEESIEVLLESIVKQSRLPDEVLFVDGGSKDQTINLLKKFAARFQQPVRLFEKKGNISSGRNYGISKAQFPLIASTDAGCRLDQDWLKYLLNKHNNKNAPVISGYALGDPHAAFEEAVVPYVLVMPDRVDPNTYLPATRSMLFEKKVWKQLGGFDEELVVSEDFAFAHKLVASGVKISFEKKALVYWKPRSNLKSFLKMIYNFAKYDVIAGIYRPKVGLIFSRYVFGLIALFFFFEISMVLTSYFLLLAVLLYSLWSIQKNKKYVPNGWYYLPVLQIGSDLAVMLGSILGFLTKKVV